MTPLLGLFLKLTLLLLGAFALAQALRHRSAALRHLVWLLALSGTLLLPLLSSVLPTVPLHVLRPPSEVVSTGSGLLKREFPVATSTFSQATPTSARQAAITAAPTRAAVEPRELLLSVWLLGSLLVAGACALGHFGLLRLVRRAVPLTDAEWSALSARLASQSGLRAPVRLVSSAVVGSPVIWGMRPVIVLPADAASWSLERRRVVLAHELAHAARGDFLAQLIASLACALLWFHPLVWLAARRLRLESEQACDDHVLLLGTQGTDYAGHLLDVARRSRALRLGGISAIGMARPSQLEGRLLAVLDRERARHAPRSPLRRTAWAGLLCLIAPLAALRPAPRVTPLIGPPATGPTAAAAAQRDSTFEETFQAAPGGELVVELESGGDLIVQGWDERSIRVRGQLSSSSLRDTRVVFTPIERGILLRVSQQTRGSFSTSHRFEIMVPRRFDVRLNSAGGSVTLREVEGQFRGTTGGGSILIERAGGLAELSTGGGEIVVSDSELDGFVTTGGGSVRMTGVRGGLRATSGGDGERIRRQQEEEITRAEAVKREKAVQQELEERAKVYKLEEVKRSSEAQKELEKRATNEKLQVEQRAKEAQKALEERAKLEQERAREVEKELEGRRAMLITREGQRTANVVREPDPGALRIEKAGGPIVVEAAPRGASLKTGGGHIEVRESAGFVDVATGGGNITIGPLAGSLRAGTGAGRVEVVLVDGEGARRFVEIESGSGAAVLTLPPGFSGRLELETAYTRSFGRPTRIESDWELERAPATEWDDREGTPRKYLRAGGTIGTGEGVVRIRVVNGDIIVRRAR